jgi:G3E family GTPase
VIETTGLADPVPLLQTLMAHPYLVMRYAIEGVVAVIDAVNGRATLEAHPESVRQVAVADRIVLTKTDLLDTPERRADADTLRARLKQLNPGAPILAPDAPADLIVPEGSAYTIGQRIPDVAAWMAEAGGHDHRHHDAHIRPILVVSDAALTPPAFELFLTLLRSAHGPRLLRVKGLVRLADDPGRPVLVHGAQHVFHPPVRLPGWPDADHRTRLVVIGAGLPENFVEELYAAFAGIPAEGRPDAAALSDNPLAPRPAGLLG